MDITLGEFNANGARRNGLAGVLETSLHTFRLAAARLQRDASASDLEYVAGWLDKARAARAELDDLSE